eukprot:761874-Pleurochrysis_carterae.AAC.2
MEPTGEVDCMWTRRAPSCERGRCEPCDWSAESGRPEKRMKLTSGEPGDLPDPDLPDSGLSPEVGLSEVCLPDGGLPS